MHKPVLILDSSLVKRWSETRLGCLLYTVNVYSKDIFLWQELEKNVIPRLRTLLEAKPLADMPNLGESRKAYKAFSKDPGRYRVSSEALYRRVRQGKELYQINSVVDANNLVSLETGFSLGSYDLAYVDGEIDFRLGTPGEVYPGIGKSDIDLENMPLLADRQGAFGSPTSDSTRAMITTESQFILTVIYAFSGRTALEEALSTAVARFKTCASVKPDNLETWIVE